MEIVVTKQWLTLPYSSGTLDNNSLRSIEISNDMQAGITVYPRQRYNFDDGTYYVRCLHGTVNVNVVNFTEAEYVANAEQIGETVEESSINTLSVEDAHSIFSDLTK